MADLVMHNIGRIVSDDLHQPLLDGGSEREY
jgi:hypothetical protein